MWPFKKKRNLGYYIIVKWCDAAADYALGYNALKRIYHVYGDGYLIPESDLMHPNPEKYSEVRLKQLKSEGIPIWDTTLGKSVPDASIIIPPVENFFGAIELRKRLRF